MVGINYIFLKGADQVYTLCKKRQPNGTMDHIFLYLSIPERGGVQPGVEVLLSWNTLVGTKAEVFLILPLEECATTLTAQRTQGPGYFQNRGMLFGGPGAARWIEPA